MHLWHRPLTLLLVVGALAGCGTAAAPGTASSASGPVAALAVRDADYESASLAKLRSFWDREGSSINAGKRFKSSGKLSAQAPDTIIEGWSANLASGSDYAQIVVSKGFLTRGMGERFFAKMGAGTNETVTVYYLVRGASSTKDRVKLVAVKRADGKLVNL